ncbi:MAG TPA: enterotoxin [Sumerlaeia bacterium]|nr:enterotoxin [Sumerlaeia bacterium]
MRRAFHLAVMLGHVAIFSGCVQLSGDAGPQEGARRSGGIEYPGQAPGRAAAKVEQNRLILENNVIRCVWSIDGGKLRPVSVTDKVAATSLEMGDAEAFHLRLDDGLHGDGPQSDGSQGEARPPAEVRYLSARDFAAAGEPRVRALSRDPRAARLAERFAGKEIGLSLVAPREDLAVAWRAELRDGANAVRQVITFQSEERRAPIAEIIAVDVPHPDAKTVGSVPGSPVVWRNLFFAYEHPRAVSVPRAEAPIGAPDGAGIRLSLKRNVPLEPSRPLTQTSAIGVTPEGQLRRGFLYYVERERAHPCRPFLHYNSWYDIAWANDWMEEAECIEAIEALGRELTAKRGVTLDSFVFDDGWDDPRTLWRINRESFPNGFAPLLAAAKRYDSALGVWMSPWGGYGENAQERHRYGREQGFEMASQGFSMAGRNYFARFLETSLDMIRRNGVNFFKYDGMNAGDAEETEAMLRLIRELRRAKRDLFVSLTTGTWPSPFWLWLGDSTWRGGGDMGWHGEGSKRQQWVTYRDMVTYRGVVQQGPLYPLNSLMTQGFAHARQGYASENGADPQEIRDEIRSFFASGTCLQELYITPQMLTSENWDDLAEAARWARANADVLADTHWVGGDPGNGEVYGWASWSERKGILALRNPSSKESPISVEAGCVFGLPPGAPTRYALRSPWSGEKTPSSVILQAGAPHTFHLQPFQALVFDATPQ